MRVTLQIDAELLDKVLALTEERSKSRAVDKALRQFVQQEQTRRLLAARGKLDLALDDWEEFRHRER
jgi:Arc/MetJ family transcription regulator